MREKWKPVVGYEGTYSVSDRGRVRREKSRKILKSTRNDRYPSVDLCLNGLRKKKQVHILVAEAFIGPCPEGMNVNHKDGKKQRSRLSNIEYGTQQHNVKEAYRLGLRNCKGEGNGKAILTGKQVRAIRKAFTGERGQKAALARKFSVSPTTIRGILSGKSWSHLK